jgi:hypothetical protein
MSKEPAFDTEVTPMQKRNIVVLTALIAALAAGPAPAQTPVQQDSPIQCVRLANIDQLVVLDDSHIVFYMKGGKKYLNTLPYPCHGLRMNDAIMYRTSLDRLCDVDVITVLDRMGQGFMPGPSCGLGTFKPITDEEIATLRKQLERSK